MISDSQLESIKRDRGTAFFLLHYSRFQKSSWNQHYTASVKWPHSITVDQVDALFNVLPLTWSCWKRLYELRENLYEPVKDSVRWETWATAVLMYSSMNSIF